MFAGVADLFVCRIKESEGVDSGNRLEVRHLGLGQAFPYGRVHKQNLGLGMVHEMVDIAGLELVKKGYRHCPIGHSGEKGHCPVHLVAPADGHFVSLLQPAMVEEDVDFGNSFSKVTVENRSTFVV